MERPLPISCALAVALLLTLAAGPAGAATGGPDAYGYTFIDSNEPSGPVYAWTDIAATGTPLGMGDDDHLHLTLPFAFDFYGTAYTEFNIGTNGVVYFGADDYLGLSNVAIPGSNTYGPEQLIAVVWDDLNPSTNGEIYYETVGTAPARRFIVQYEQVARFGTSDYYTCQVQLEEASWRIVVSYESMSGSSYPYGSSATAGIQMDATVGLQYSYDQQALTDGLTIVYSACEGLDNDGDGFTDCDGDCDDNSVDTYPGAPELCDGLDNDCDGIANDAVDGDGDGVTPCDGDCDDGEPTVFPGNPEVCDGLDNDCNGVVDDGVGDDNDGDGVTVCQGDCDDSDPSVYPGAPDPCDGIDSDCGGDLHLENDDDNDGYAECDGDCDDSTSAVYPGHPEECDGLDNDCDPLTDETVDNDGDGQSACDGDCDDQNPAAYLGATEVCDGFDNNCDGIADEGFDQDGDDYTTCEGDCDDTDPTVHPDATELCVNGKDDDCDGLIDDQDPDCGGGDDDSGDDDDAADDDAADDDSAGGDDDDAAPPTSAGFGACECEVDARADSAVPAALLTALAALLAGRRRHP